MLHDFNSFSYNSITFNNTIFIEAATIVTEIVMINCRIISPRFYTEWWINENSNKLVIAQKLFAEKAKTTQESVNKSPLQSRLSDLHTIRTPTERNPRSHFSINTLTKFKAERKKYLIKYYIIQKRFSLKILLFMYLADFIFVVSHLKIHPAVHLNTSKALTSL